MQGSRRWLYFVGWLLSALFLLSACGRGENIAESPTPGDQASVSAPAPPASPPVPNPDGTGGELLLTRFTDLIVSRADGSDQRIVFRASEGFSLLDPTWSPDGSRIALVRQKLFIPRRQEDYGSDILVINRDGSGERTALAHKVAGEFLRVPSWTPDGKALLISRSTPVRQGGQASLEFAIERLDLDTGNVTPVVRDAFGGTLSPDGRKLAYVALDARTFEQALVVSDLNGRNPLIVASNRQRFEAFNPPKFAPDGSQLLFAASGSFDFPVTTPTPGRRNQRPVESALARNGLPWDVWMVKPDGSELKRLTTLAEDQPWAAWSSDGRFILLIGSTGRYLMRADGSELRRLGDGLMHAQFDWR